MSGWYSPGKWLTVYDQRAAAAPPVTAVSNQTFADAVRHEAYRCWLNAGCPGAGLAPYWEQARTRVLRQRLGLDSTDEN